HEIEYLGRSGLERDRRIPVDDLRVSVADGRVVLRSARWGREVLPRLSTAHDFGRSSGVYRFLCALQSQGVASDLGWDWGPLAASASPPRGSLGRVVLSRARWALPPQDVRRIRSAGRAVGIAELRERRGLPRWVALAERDHEMPVDLDDDEFVETSLIPSL